MKVSDLPVSALITMAVIALRLDVPCPQCGSGIEDPCRTPAGRYMPRVHAMREVASSDHMYDVFRHVMKLEGRSCERSGNLGSGDSGSVNHHGRSVADTCDPARERIITHFVYSADGMIIGAVDGTHITAETPIDPAQFKDGNPWGR